MYMRVCVCLCVCCVQMWLGGSPNQTRLAELYQDRVRVRDLDAWLESLFLAFKDGRKKDERFGDWVARTGLPGVKAAQEKHQAQLKPPAPQAAPAGAAAPRAPAAKVAAVNASSNGTTATLTKPAVDATTMAVLEAAAKAQGKTVAELAAELAKQLGH